MLKQNCVKKYFLEKKIDTREGNCCRLDVRKIPPAVHHPYVEEVRRRRSHPVVEQGVAGGEGEGGPALHLGDGGPGGVVGEVQVQERLLAGNDLVVPACGLTDEIFYSDLVVSGKKKKI